MCEGSCTNLPVFGARTRAWGPRARDRRFRARGQQGPGLELGPVGTASAHVASVYGTLDMRLGQGVGSSL